MIELILGNPILLAGTGVLAYIVYLLYPLFFGGEKGKNPFDQDHRRPHQPFVHDLKSRDAVLKQKFKPGKVPQDLDAIIIGSGMGGLTTGVLLSRAGLKVLVLEQHDQAGGCCHSFVEKGFEFDTGIHYIGGLHEGSEDKVLLDSLTCGQLRWSKMDDAFDIVVFGDPFTSKVRKYPMVSGKERYIQNLINMFPKEKEGILKFIDLMFKASESYIGIVIPKLLPRRIVSFLLTTGLYKVLFSAFRNGYLTKTLQECLDELITDKELKAVLSYLGGDYGVRPCETPLILHAALITHYINGSYYPQSGSSEIGFHTIQEINKNGGNVLVQAQVNEILVDKNGRAIGVTVGKEQTAFHAPYIVSNAGVVNTFKTLLPKHIAVKSEIYPLIDKVGQSVSFITTFIGVDGDSKELNLPSGNLWTYKTNDINESVQKQLATKACDIMDLDISFMFISFPSAKDSEWNAKFPGKSSFLAITYANWDWFKDWKDEKLKHRGDRYEAVKDMIGRKMWQYTVELYPQLDGKMVHMDVGTPVTNRHYLAQPAGEMYGLHQDTKRFEIDSITKLRPDTDIPGLYLTGQDILGCGFVTAMAAGMLTSSQILNRNLYDDFEVLRAKVNAKDGIKPGKPENKKQD